MPLASIVLFTLGVVLIILGIIFKIKVSSDWDVIYFCMALFSIAVAIVVLLCPAEKDSCPNCGYKTDYSFCEKCGTEIEPSITCPECNEKYDIEDAPDYCRECGTKIEQEPTETEKLE